MTNREDRHRTFGVEEEYLLLDASTGLPMDTAAEVIDGDPELIEQTDRELFQSQIETATPVCTSAAEAEQTLSAFRASASREAATRGAVLSSTGLPPVGGDEAGTVTPKSRYHRIIDEMRGVAEYQYTTGTHVHVAIPSRDAGVEVLARLARWAPALLALSANSPIWCGEDTGFASWRHIKGMSWPIAGYPPEFENGDEYDRAVERIVDTGLLFDTGLLTWVARLSTSFPTIELRIADAQLEVGDSVAFAVLVRALVDRALTEAERGEARPRYSPGLVNGASWAAARDGMAADLIDPLEAEALPAFSMVERMVASVEPELERFGDLERVQTYVDGLRAKGGPAHRQIAAFERGGVEALLRLYQTSGVDHQHLSAGVSSH